MKKLYHLNPYLEKKPWGSHVIPNLKKLSEMDLIGESWEVSSYPSKSSMCGNDKLSHMAHLNYLVKFIHAQIPLSVQVHPGDEYAQKFENEKGKTECWLVLDCPLDAYVLLGIKPGISKDDFYMDLQNKQPMDRHLNKVHVKKGDFIVIPSGLIHAIGENILLLEIQQSSGVTYRVWDWDRLEADGSQRPLHINKAMDNINFDEEFNLKFSKVKKSDIFSKYTYMDLIQHPDFKVIYCSINKNQQINKLINKNSAIICLSGDMNIRKYKLHSYQSLFIPEKQNLNIKASSYCHFIIVW
jgi:mannose-6-phosphate isomerase